MENKPKLSVVIPAYNEEKRISQTLEETNAYLKGQSYSYEIIVVDNASNDNTCDLVRQYQKQTIKNLVTLCLSKSIGAKGSAVKLGISDYAKGDYVIFMDADNATPISEIAKFWPYFQSGQSEVVIGSRYVSDSNVTAKQPLYRVLLSRMSNMLIQIMVAPGIHDTQMGFKMFTGAAAKDIFSQVTVPGWGFDMEVLTIAHKHGYRIREVGVLWREKGGSHVPLSAYLQSLGSLFKIKWNAIIGKYRKSS